MTCSTHHVAKYFTAHTPKLDPTRTDIDALHPCVGLGLAASATIVFPGTASAATTALTGRQSTTLIAFCGNENE